MYGTKNLFQTNGVILTFYSYKNPERNKEYGFHKNIKQHNSFQH